MCEWIFEAVGVTLPPADEKVLVADHSGNIEYRLLKRDENEFGEKTVEGFMAFARVSLSVSASQAVGANSKHKLT